MESYYGLAGRLIEYYRNQKYKAGDERFCVKNFLEDETGQHICSFPTYKKMASGEVAKNEGFYYFLATKLGQVFDAHYLLTDDFVHDFENEFYHLVESHQKEQIRLFCDYYEEMFAKMNTGLVMFELQESLHLLSLVFDDKQPTIDINKMMALASTSQSASFVLSLYYLLYYYFRFIEIDRKMENHILKLANHLEKPSQSSIALMMDALYDRNMGADVNQLKEKVAVWKDGRSVWHKYLYHFVIWDDKKGKLPFSCLEEMNTLLEEMRLFTNYFTKNDYLWLSQLMCRHCFYYERNELALHYAKKNLELSSKAAYQSLLILFNIYNQQGRSFDKELIDQFNTYNFPDLPEISVILEYIHQRLNKDGILKAERMIMGRLIPLFKKTLNNYFFNYLFYKELVLCVKETGHQDLLKVYRDFVLEK